MAQQPAVSPYGELSPDAPEELRLFSFLIGKWEGKGRTELPDGEFAEYELTWIGRYILDGMAIADELHAPFPDGSPGLGITIRHFDQTTNGWIIEFVNVSGSFIRRQVNSRYGAVEIDGDTITVVSEDGASMSREHYALIGDSKFSYTMDISSDGGVTWDRAPFEFQFDRASEGDE